MDNMLRLLYVSEGRADLSRDDLAAILAAARKHNKAAGITGALCFRGGYFAQVLEGPEVAVLETYLRVIRDDRHTAPVLITIGTTTRRIYDGWFMGGISDERIAFVDIAEVMALRNSAGDGDSAPMMMQRWLTLLQAQTLAARAPVAAV